MQKTLKDLLDEIDDISKKVEHTADHSPSAQEKQKLRKEMLDAAATVAEYMDKENPYHTDNPSYRTYRQDLDAAKRNLQSAINVSAYAFAGTHKDASRMEGKSEQEDSPLARVKELLHEARKGVQKAVKNPIYQKIEP